MSYRARSMPYGDVFQSSNSAVDMMAARLFAEQRQRQAQQQQDIKGMDDMFAKNVSGVRDEDIPEIAQSYNEWKTAKINLAKNPNGKDRIQRELEAQRKMANTFQQISNSKQMLNSLKDNGKKVAAKPDDHYDDAPSLIASTNGVPTSKFNTLVRPDPNGETDPVTGKVKMVGFDPADYNSYVDRGNVKNWQPIIKTAIGSLKDVTPISEDYKDDKGVVLGQQVTPIKATASPTSYMANMSQYVYSGVGRLKHFTNSFRDSYTDENAQKIATDYYDQAKNNPLWKQAWGENGVAIPPEALANPNTRVLALNSMEYALNNPPQLGKPTNVPNVPNLMDKKRKEGMVDKKEMADYNDNLIRGRIKLRADLGLNPPTISQYVTFDQTGEEEDVPVETTGGVFGFGKNRNGKISKGIVYDGDGKPMASGEIKINGDKLPATVVAVLRAAKIIDPKLHKAPNVTAVVSDGEIKSIKTPNGDVSRQQMLEFQQSYDKERKGEGLFRQQNKPVKTNPPKIKATTKSGLPVFHKK